MMQMYYVHFLIQGRKVVYSVIAASINAAKVRARGYACSQHPGQSCTVTNVTFERPKDIKINDID